MRHSGGRDRLVLARTLRQTISARQADDLPWSNKSVGSTMTDERVSNRAMGARWSAASDEAKRIRRRGYVDMEPRMKLLRLLGELTNVN
jgi:hypothetical protein